MHDQIFGGYTDKSDFRKIKRVYKNSKDELDEISDITRNFDFGIKEFDFTSASNNFEIILYNFEHYVVKMNMSHIS